MSECGRRDETHGARVTRDTCVSLATREETRETDLVVTFAMNLASGVERALRVAF